MSKVHFCEEGQAEGAEFDCPDCGSDAIQTDAGPVCSNPDCPTNN